MVFRADRGIEGWQTKPCARLNDLIEMPVREWFRDHQKRTMWLADKSTKNCLSLAIVVRSTLHDVYVLIGLLGRRNQARSVGRGVWIEQDTHFRQVRYKLVQQL